MRRSIRSISGVSPRSKNMPSLVRAACTSLPPVAVSTVSERTSRGVACAIRPSHSCAVSRSAKITTRGRRSDITTLTGCPSTTMTLAPSSICGAGTLEPPPGTASRRLARWPRRVCSIASSATSSCQPLATMALTTSSGRQPASAWAMIQRRNSGVTCWTGVVVLVVWVVVDMSTPAAEALKAWGGPGESLGACRGQSARRRRKTSRLSLLAPASSA